MIFITEESDLDLNNNFTVLYFYASWMPYHKKMFHMFSKIEEKYKNTVFYAIDVDNFKKNCKRFDVIEIPTIIIRDSDKEIKRSVGLILNSAFNKMFADICK